MTQLNNMKMNDGSRYFWGSNANGCASELWKLLPSLPAAEKKKTTGLDESWLEFTYKGYSFAIHDHWSGVSFIADDPSTPEHHLQRIVQHLASAC